MDGSLYLVSSRVDESINIGIQRVVVEIRILVYRALSGSIVSLCVSIGSTDPPHSCGSKTLVDVVALNSDDCFSTYPIAY
eukprot:scaffold218219_cov55-Attheya_sp.AAC.2